MIYKRSTSSNTLSHDNLEGPIKTRIKTARCSKQDIMRIAHKTVTPETNNADDTVTLNIHQSTTRKEIHTINSLLDSRRIISHPIPFGAIILDISEHLVARALI